ncbi:MAG: ribonuclease P protein component 1 [Halobacteria archaeon]
MTVDARREAVRHELIGRHVRAVESSDPTYVGVEGTVVYETTSTLHVRKEGEGFDDGVVVLPKSETTFEFGFGDGTVEIDGSVIEERPADRVKMKVK